MRLPLALRGELFKKRWVKAGSEADFGFAGFGEDFQLVIAPTLDILPQDNAKWLDNLVLQRPFVGRSGFDGHGIAACFVLFLKDEALQRHVLGHNTQIASGLDPTYADDAAVPVFEPLTKGIPGFLR